MPAQNHCPSCDRALPVNAPDGLCPVCLLRQGMDSEAMNLEHPGGPGATVTLGEDIRRRSVLDAITASLGSFPGTSHCEIEGHTASALPNPDRKIAVPLPVVAGRYQLLGEIGRGGMGAVHRGHDNRLGRDLALKVLLAEHADRSELVQRFIEEAQVGCQLQHPGIAPIYDQGNLADQRPYFTMKLVKGRTWGDLLSDRSKPAIDLPRFLGVFEKVCQTMAYAHAHLVIHRDLKPSNIMVGAFGEVQVMDWGLAKVLTKDAPRSSVESDEDVQTIRTGSDAALSRAGSILGTPAYMSPEQARGETGRIDERTDVFALGAILCEILTGKPPYRATSAREVLAMAARADLVDAFARLDGCGADLELRELAGRCLSADPEERPSQAAEVAGAITAYLASVQERLRQAELAKVEAQTRTEEEAKRRVLADQLALGGGEGGHRTVPTPDGRRADGHPRRAGRHRLRGRSVAGIAAPRPVRSIRRGAGEGNLARNGGTGRARRPVASGGSARRSCATEGYGPRCTRPRDPRRITDLVNVVDSIDRDRVVIEKLAEIRSASLDDRDGMATEAGYSDALIEAGVRVYEQSPEEIGAAIRAKPRTMAEALTAALDDWASVLRDRYRPADEGSSGRPERSHPSTSTGGGSSLER